MSNLQIVKLPVRPHSPGSGLPSSRIGRMMMRHGPTILRTRRTSTNTDHAIDSVKFRAAHISGVDMKIVDIKTHVLSTAWRNLTFVQVVTDVGLTGIGEVRMLNHTDALLGYLAEAGPNHILGHDP